MDTLLRLKGYPMIDFTLLGTSALLPLPDRALTAAALRYQGHTILFDCGEGTQAAARKADVSLMGCGLIALTHYHGDHIFGLPGLLQTMLSMNRTAPVWIIGPEGLHTAMKPVLSLAGPLPYPVRLRQVQAGETLLLKDLDPAWPEAASLTPIRTSHRVPSVGYAFSVHRPGRFMPERAEALGVPKNMWGLLQKGQSVSCQNGTILPRDVTGPERRGLKVVFSGDTASCPSLKQGARDADLLVCEATYGDDRDTEIAAQRGHMTFSQAGQLAASAQVKRLWLCHFSQKLRQPEDFLPAAAAHFPEAVCGLDGLSIHLRFPVDEADGPAL